MLQRIRKAADRLLIRLLLGLIAFAFVAWGITDVLRARNDYDIVTFSGAENIPDSEFLKAKSEEISMIQRQNGTNLTKDQIKQLGIDKVVLNKLITDRIMKYIVKYYQLDLSDNTIINFIKESAVFKNKQGLFDAELFRSVIRNSYRNEEEYVKEMKEQMLKKTLISIFLESFKAPDVMVQNIVDYMAESREFDLVQIDLKKPRFDINIAAPTTEQLEQFYNDNQNKFTIPEKRNFTYINISPEILLKKIVNSDTELRNFYNENKEEFTGQNFDKIKKQVETKLNEQKLESMYIELLQRLEDDVAAGLKIKEIGDKFVLEIKSAKNQTYENVIADQIYGKVADIIFDLTEEELSYPIELPDKKGILLVGMSSIDQSKVEPLELITDKATSIWRQQQIAKTRLKSIDNLSKEYKPSEANIKNLSSIGIEITQPKALVRADLDKNNKLPPELLMAIFQTKPGMNTTIFQHEDIIYFAHIKSVKLDNNSVKKIQKSSAENIATTIKNGLLDELIAHFIIKTNMKANIRE